MRSKGLKKQPEKVSPAKAPRDAVEEHLAAAKAASERATLHMRRAAQIRI